MPQMVMPRPGFSLRRVSSLVAVLIAATVLSLLAGGGAAAAQLVGKDGRIHACYRVKGRAKGTLRVVRSARARCPRGWKKVAWNAAGPAGGGATGETGPAGATGNGEAGSPGSTGASGTTGEKGTVLSLEKQVSELLTKVKSLEGILAGINNAQLKEAIGAVPVVGALCSQAKSLNEQSGKLGESMKALNTVLGPLLIAFVPVTVPTALPAFSC